MSGMSRARAKKAPINTVNLRWLVPVAGLVTLTGYFGPWIDHPVAGLVITGLDMAEYVKFLAAVRSGLLTLWRQGYYLPLFAVSLTASLYAFRREPGYGWPMRVVMLLMAVVAALNMLPPAWTPPLMLTAEFRLQAIAIAFCLGVAGISPFAAQLPRQVTGGITLALALPAIWVPVRDFLRVLPEITAIYGQPQSPAWGMYVMIGGLIGLAGAGALTIWRQPVDR